MQLLSLYVRSKMDYLLQLIHALPLDKFCAFMNVKKNLQNENVEKPKREMMLSLLVALAHQNDIAEEELLKFTDPIIEELVRFNENLVSAWSNCSESEFSEDTRLDITINFLKFRQKQDIKSKNYVVKMQTVEKKLYSLVDLNTRLNQGYAANVLTSLYSSISNTRESIKKKFEVQKESDTVSKVTDFLINNQSHNADESNKKIRKLIKAIEIYSSLVLDGGLESS